LRVCVFALRSRLVLTLTHRTRKHHAMSASHVSDSLGNVSDEEPRTEPRVLRHAVREDEKQLRVAEHVVREMLVSKQRKLTIEVNVAMEALHEARAPALQCGCRTEACAAVPCERRVELREALFRATARECWPRYEQELVADVARALIDARRAGARSARAPSMRAPSMLARVEAVEGRVAAASLECAVEAAVAAFLDAQSAERAADV